MLEFSGWSSQLSDFVKQWKLKRTEECLGDNPFPRFALQERAESWDDFLQWTDLPGSWCFRGQRESQWSLCTSLDRQVEEHSFTSKDSLTVETFWHRDRDLEEKQNIRLFSNHLEDHNLPGIPPQTDLGSCFAVMQHYGTPTRFLDWTNSPFVAAYFAFEEDAREQGRCSAIWALDLDWLAQRARELLPENLWPVDFDSGAVDWRQNNLLIGNDKPTILTIEPRYSNERMIAQKGVLLCKLRHDVHFSFSLMYMMINPELVDEPVLRKLEIHTSRRNEFLRNLKGMNIDRASLFPDEDSQ